jgi:hypothetical protein
MLAELQVRTLENAITKKSWYQFWKYWARILICSSFLFPIWLACLTWKRMMPLTVAPSGWFSEFLIPLEGYVWKPHAKRCTLPHILKTWKTNGVSAFESLLSGPLTNQGRAKRPWC